MPWPEQILEQFDQVPARTIDESEYYGPYNSLLSFLFPVDEGFQVAPKCKGPVYPGSNDFRTIYVVNVNKRPVFFIEIKPRGHLQNMGARGAADEQMRDGFYNLVGNLVIPKLFGISAMGTAYSIYEYGKDTTKIFPAAIHKDFSIINDYAPVTRWG